MIEKILLLSFLILACNNESRKHLHEMSDSLIKDHGSKVRESNITLNPGMKIWFPIQILTLNEIDKTVSRIDYIISNNDYKTERVYGLDETPCEIIKYYKDDTLLQIEMGCRDCQNFMSTEKYYFKEAFLIYVKSNYVDYGYNPCISEKDLIEFGITGKFKKDNLKERNEEYHFLDSQTFFFKRTGNLKKSPYIENDTISPKAILELANLYLNAKEPE